MIFQVLIIYFNQNHKHLKTGFSINREITHQKELSTIHLRSKQQEDN